MGAPFQDKRHSEYVCFKNKDIKKNILISAVLVLPFNLDQFFDQEVISRAKNIFSFEHDGALSQEIEKILILSKQMFTPFVAKPCSHEVLVLNSVASGIVQPKY